MLAFRRKRKHSSGRSEQSIRTIRHITQQEGITTVRLPSKKCLGETWVGQASWPVLLRVTLPHWQPEGAALFLTWRLHGSLPRTVEILERSSPGKVFVRHGPAWPRWLPMRSGSGGLVYLYHLDLSRGPACRGSPRPSIKNHSAR